MNRTRHGFTLIELLVVVTIIVVLLALLVPAMDKAIAAAEYAVCGTNLKGMGNAVSTYAYGNQRTYPHRNSRAAGGAACEIYAGGNDDRAILNDIMGIDGVLNCPLSGFGGDVSFNDTPAPAYIVTSYQMWFGGNMLNANGATGMLRVGQRPSYGGVRFNVLASDLLRTFPQYQGLHSSHPDKAGSFSSMTVNDGTSRASSFQSFGLNNNYEVDQNFLYTDGSIERINDLQYPEHADAPDQGLYPVPHYSNDENQAKSYLPGTK